MEGGECQLVALISQVLDILYRLFGYCMNVYFNKKLPDFSGSFFTRLTQITLLQDQR